MIRPPKVYGIADGDALGLGSEEIRAGKDDPVTAAVTAMAEAGIRWIQIRLKSADDRQLFRITERCTRRLEGSEVRLWVDDRPDVAALLPVFGVHVGQNDLPPEAARAILSSTQVIGLSCHDETQIRQANESPAVDVVACGPVFPTRSKKAPDPTIGLAGVAAARRLTQKPLVAIGGIDLETAPRVLDAGADTVAVLGALCRGNVGQNSARWVKALEERTDES